MFQLDRKFITPGNFFFAEELGSQMLNLATYFFFAHRTNQSVVIFREFADRDFGFLVKDAFPNCPVKVLSLGDLSSSERKFKTLKLESSFFANIANINLSPEFSYVVPINQPYYKIWWADRRLIFKYFRFPEQVFSEASALVNQHKRTGVELIAMHVRRSGHALRGMHSILGLEYYKRALGALNRLNASVLIFSDDIEHCREIYTKDSLGYEVYYSSATRDVVDMAAIGLCDHVIVANSTFSFWGALLGEGVKSVVCPGRFIKTIDQDNEWYKSMFINFIWAPDDWIVIDNLEERFPVRTPIDDDFKIRYEREMKRMRDKSNRRPKL